MYFQAGNQKEIRTSAAKHVQERFEGDSRDNFEHLYSSGRKA